MRRAESMPVHMTQHRNIPMPVETGPPVEAARTVDYAMLDSLDIRAVSKSDQRQLLESFGLSTIGKPGMCVCVSCALVKVCSLGGCCSQFDYAPCTRKWPLKPVL